MLSLSGLFFDAYILCTLPLQLADARDAREEVENQELFFLKTKNFLTGFAKDFPVSLSPPALVMIVLFEFLNFENEEDFFPT